METEKLRIVELAGTPRERGQVHGEELRDSIQEVLRIAGETVRRSVGTDLDEHISALLRYGRFETAILEHAPELWDEVAGLAEGAGISLEAARFLQLPDEDWVFREKVCVDRQVNRDACTAFALNTPAGTLAGQNMDIGYVDPHQVLFRIAHADSDLQSYVFSVAGTLALNGMNNGPLGICCNALLQLRSSAAGLPVALIVRRVLEQGSFNDAVRFLQRIPHASGQNYVIAAPGRVGSLECSAGTVAALRSDPAIAGICHTNHPLGNDDVEPREVVARTTIAGRYANSIARLDSIRKRVGEAAPDVGIEDMKLALGAHDDEAYPICRHYDPAGTEKAIGYTAGSMIYDLSVEEPTLHLASGPPCHTAYRQFRLATRASRTP